MYNPIQTPSAKIWHKCIKLQYCYQSQAVKRIKYLGLHTEACTTSITEAGIRVTGHIASHDANSCKIVVTGYIASHDANICKIVVLEARCLNIETVTEYCEFLLYHITH